MEQNREINHGDDNPADSPVILKPTRLAALQAAATLRSYLEDIDGPFARRLELGLATFGRETQLECTKKLASTSITDYFTSKAS